jgi:hypothetical protein
LLLRAGADPNARDNWSYTPLHEVRLLGMHQMLILLTGYPAKLKAGYWISGRILDIYKSSKT